MYQRRYVVNGVEMEFVTIGALAEALNRSPVTLRRWERQGLLPPPKYWRTSDTPRGRRRLYTVEQVRRLQLAATRSETLYLEDGKADMDSFTRLAKLAFS